jgi:glycine C-acetyltransferase
MIALAEKELECGLADFATLDPIQFDAYYQYEEKKGHTLYRRMATSPMDAVVDIVHDGQSRKCIMLGSNNYLGFANDPYVKLRVIEAMDQFGCGVSGPPLLNGHTSLHRELEQRLAKLKHSYSRVVIKPTWASWMRV